MKIITFFTFILLSSTFAQADEFLKRTALNGKVTFTTPKSFGPMPKEIIEIKYPDSKPHP